MDRTPEFARLSDYPKHYSHSFPDREAIVDFDPSRPVSRISWAAFEDRIARYAKALHAAGVKKGDRIATFSNPSGNHLVIYMAVLRIGAIWVGLNPKLMRAELSHQITDSGAKLIFVAGFQEDIETQEKLLSLKTTCASVQDLIWMDANPPEGFLDKRAFLKAQAAAADYLTAVDAVSADDPAIIVYTSGTTGVPKGAVLSHGAVIFSARMQCEHWWASPLRTINNLPINHVGGAVQLAAYAIVAGGTLVNMPRFDAAKIPLVIQSENITVIHQVPAMYQKICDIGHPEAYDLSSLQCLIWSGSACAPDLLAKLSKWCDRLFTSYGQTEASGEVLYTSAGDSHQALLETVGRPVTGIDVRRASADGLLTTEAGLAGEIQVKSSCVMTGYWERAEATTAAFTPDGWLRTGDLAIEDPEGRFRIVGRVKEMFKSGGYNVYPREVESVLENDPAIATAIVVPVPDADFDEVGHAFLVAKGTGNLDLEAVKARCKELLANYKVPKSFSQEASLPMLPIGKIDRSSLKKMALQRRQT